MRVHTIALGVVVEDDVRVVRREMLCSYETLGASVASVHTAFNRNVQKLAMSTVSHLDSCCDRSSRLYHCRRSSRKQVPRTLILLFSSDVAPGPSLHQHNHVTTLSPFCEVGMGVLQGQFRFVAKVTRPR